MSDACDIILSSRKTYSCFCLGRANTYLQVTDYCRTNDPNFFTPVVLLVLNCEVVSFTGLPNLLKADGIGISIN